MARKAVEISKEVRNLRRRSAGVVRLPTADELARMTRSDYVVTIVYTYDSIAKDIKRCVEDIGAGKYNTDKTLNLLLGIQDRIITSIRFLDDEIVKSIEESPNVVDDVLYTREIAQLYVSLFMKLRDSYSNSRLYYMIVRPEKLDTIVGKLLGDNVTITTLEGLPKKGVGESIGRDEISIRAALKARGLSNDVIDQMIAVIPREHFLDAASGLPTELPKPDEIPLYHERPDREMNAIEFYRQHWKPYADAGLLFQHQLNDYDPKLIPAIRAHCSRNKLNAADVLPGTKVDETRAEILKRGLTAEQIRQFANHIARHGMPEPDSS